MQPLRSRRTRVRLLWLALAAVALVSLPRYVTLGAPFDPDLLLGFLALLLRAAFWLWLVLLLLPGVTGWARRSHRGWWRSWRHGSSARPAATQRGTAPGAWAVGRPPLFRSVQVTPTAVSPGQPVTVSWHAEDAEQVALGDQTGLPPQGSALLVPTASGPVRLTAMNRHGTSSSSTQHVHVSPPRRIDLSAVPVPPPAPVPTAQAPVPPPVPPAPLLRLDVVVARQQARRTAQSAPAAPGPARHDLTPDPELRRPR